MSKKIEFTPAFWSAVKRKNVLDLLKVIFEEAGETEALEIATSTTRFTNASIERMMKATGYIDELPDYDEDNAETPAPTLADDEAPVEVVADAPEDLTYADMTVDHSFKDIRKAIKKGKGKKALKLIQEAKDNGARGSVLKDLNKQAKGL